MLNEKIYKYILQINIHKKYTICHNVHRKEMRDTFAGTLQHLGSGLITSTNLAI